MFSYGRDISCRPGSPLLLFCTDQQAETLSTARFKPPSTLYIATCSSSVACRSVANSAMQCPAGRIYGTATCNLHPYRDRGQAQIRRFPQFLSNHVLDLPRLLGREDGCASCLAACKMCSAPLLISVSAICPNCKSVSQYFSRAVSNIC